MAQVENKAVLTVSEINNFYHLFVRNGYIDINCSVIKPDQILNHVLIGNKRMHQIGVIDDGKYAFWDWVKDEDKDFEWSMIRHVTKGSIGTHFTVGDKNFKEFYDSMKGSGYKSLDSDWCALYKVF
jgi:hypothetical protein